MDQLSVIKWTIMEKAKFGLHSLNAEKKSFPTAARLGTACCRRRRTDDPVTCNGGMFIESNFLGHFFNFFFDYLDNCDYLN